MADVLPSNDKAAPDGAVNNKIENTPLVTLLLEKLIGVARGYCIRSTEAFFLLKRLPRPGVVAVWGDNKKLYEGKGGDIAPQVLNWLLFALCNCYDEQERLCLQRMSLKVEFDEDDATKRYTGLERGIEIELFNIENKDDKELADAWKPKPLKGKLKSITIDPEDLKSPEKLHRPFQSMESMAKNLREHYRDMIELVRNPSEAEINDLLWGKHVVRPKDKDKDAMFLALDHPLVQYNLYCAFELVSRYAGWDLKFFCSGWNDFWIGNRPHKYRQKDQDADNHHWSGLKNSPSLENYFNYLDPSDLLMLLFDRVVGDCIHRNFLFPHRSGRQEILLRGATIEEIKSQPSFCLMVGKPFEEKGVAKGIFSRRHISLIRLAEKIMQMYIKGERKPIRVVIMGDVAEYDKEQLKKLIYAPNTWRVPIDEVLDETRIAIKYYPDDPKDDKSVRSIYDEKIYKECHLVFILDCDELYEDQPISREEKFSYLRAHSCEEFYAKGCLSNGYADGIHPETTMFHQAWQYLDSYNESDKDTCYKRSLSLNRLRHLRRTLNGSSAEIYIYASDAPDDSNLALYREDGLRVCRRESFGGSSVTVMLVANMPGSTLPKEKAKCEVTIPLWQLFKSFDSYFSKWIGEAQLPRYSIIDGSLTAKEARQKALPELLLDEKKPEKLDIAACAEMLKQVKLALNYEGLIRKKEIQYYFQFSKDIIDEKDKNKGKNPRDRLRLECFLRKMAADFFQWLQREGLPRENHALTIALSNQCRRVLHNCLLGNTKSMEDMFFFHAIDSGGWYVNGLQWVYSESRERKYEARLKHLACTDDMIPPNYIDRFYCAQLMRAMDAPDFTLGNETFVERIPIDVNEAAKAIHRVCGDLGYTFSPMYTVSRRYIK